MNSTILVLLVSCVIISVDAAFQPNPQRKTWWAKQITDDFYITGRLSARQIKYAHEDGFQSILSVVNFTEPKTNGLEEFPTTADCQEIAKSAGIPYEVVVPPSGNWKQDLEFVRQFTVLADSLPKPILVHCEITIAAMFALMNYFANKYRNDTSFSPKVDAKSFFEIGSLHGMNFNDTEMKETISMVTGEKIIGSVAVPGIPMGWEWSWNWQIKPVYKDIFIAGQIYSTSLSTLNNTGFKSLINNRRGVAFGRHDATPYGPSQEEVTLLNIRDQTGTYAEGGRQNITRLLATRIDPSRPNTYISNTSLVNYEARNQLEFGDDVGYNETMERQAVEAAGLKYYHHPTGTNTMYKYTVASWGAMRTETKEAIARGPVLFHSSSGFRSGIWAILAAADYYGLDYDWALKRSRELGFSHDSNSDQVKLWKEVLIKDTTIDETNNGHRSTFMLTVPLLVFWVVTYNN